MNECRTVSVSVARPPDEVYDYLADPARFPRWSAFIQAIRPEGDEWVATTPEATVRIRFTERNAFRILDHRVTVKPDVVVDVPMRVLANGDGSEVTFSVFRQPGMTDEQFEEDVRMVVTDLENLKRVLERED